MWDGNGSTKAGKRLSASDGCLCLLIALGVLVYLHWWPNNLYDADESYFLLDAKRISEGEALYRDIFWLSTPLAHWLMAIVFAVFGASIEVARFAMAVSHAATAGLVAATCRRLGVRWSLALIPPLAYIGLCYPCFDCASPHWIATTLIVSVLYVAVGTQANPARRAATLGVLTAAIGAIYQQQGAAFLLVLALLFGAEHLAAIHIGERPAPRVLYRNLSYFAGGVIVLAAPIVVWMIVTAGFYQLFDQLVLLPFTGYQATNQASWGQVGLMTLSYARRTYPLLFKYLPVLLVIAAVRTLWMWRRGEDMRVLLSLSFVCAAAALSVMHNPDFIHIAFIAPPFFVLAAEMGERGRRWMDRRIVFAKPLAWLLSAGLLVALIAKASGTLERIRSTYVVSYQSAFGRIDLPNKNYIPFIDHTRHFLEESPSKEIFSFPVFTSLYLTAGARNATRYSALVTTFNSPRQVAEVLHTLQEKRLPLIVMCEIFLGKDDAIPRWVHQNYEVLYEPKPRNFPCTLYGRRGIEWQPSQG